MGASEWRQGASEGAVAALQVREDGGLHQRDGNGSGTIGRIYLKMELEGFDDGLDVRVSERVKGDSKFFGVVKPSCRSLSWGAPWKGRFVERNQKLSLGQTELDMHDRQPSKGCPPGDMIWGSGERSRPG